MGLDFYLPHALQEGNKFYPLLPIAGYGLKNTLLFKNRKSF
jgi:hypothetical protein